MKKFGLLPKIVIAIVLGIFIGGWAPEFVVRTLTTFNGIFGNFLDFSIPLIIIAFVAPGIGDLGKGAGRLLAITAGIAYTSTIVSGLFAYLSSKLMLNNFIKIPSLGLDSKLESSGLESFFTIEINPIFGVMTALVLAFILGIGIASIETDSLKKIMKEIQVIISGLIDKLIIPLLPIHILGIFANMTYSGSVFTILSVFSKVFVMVIVLHLLILLFQFALAGLVSNKNPIKLLKTMLPAYLTAVGTQSSAATIPVTLEQTKKNGVSEYIADFVVPLCATIHLSGSTITLVTCSMAIMLLNGMNISFNIMFPFILMLGITMVAAPGVPGGAVMAALGLLEVMLDFPQPMLTLMISLYIAQDSFGTAANVTGDGAIAILVDKIYKKQ